MKIVTTPAADSFITERGGQVWVWLDPRRGLVGSYVWLEAHCEPPGSSRRSRFTLSSKRPHRFKVQDGDGLRVNYAFARLDAPEELHLDVRGMRKGTKGLEAYRNGCVFAGPDVPAPRGAKASLDPQALIRSPFGSQSGSFATVARTRSPNTSTS